MVLFSYIYNEIKIYKVKIHTLNDCPISDIILLPQPGH
jgi:hypothetical protein